ncbi:hypothetical protein OR1_01745 [Geobacter sp. OR-1]|uniref:DUF1697 domain-containing protein n=1 Tax=Geobacter sp. OR-1 TaxID=1266765 RepID=UPI000542C29F|nr:DUF1697 domain-containing protein [Geobacter sp. OR-1]GAM09466.1 hypothetical protein OR1_01745 [Geobacter sp. OR-1]
MIAATERNSYVILLRGVMPTGRNRVPMAQLRTALIEAGLVGVRTYIQSGNVVAAASCDAATLEQLVHDTIREKIGAEIAVIVRTPEEFRRILAYNPFADADNSKLYFTLFQTPPDPARLRELLAIDCGPDAIRVTDYALYTLYATRHSDSRFTNNFFESRLKVKATTRNFNTISKLVDWCD